MLSVKVMGPREIIMFPLMQMLLRMQKHLARPRELRQENPENV